MALLRYNRCLHLFAKPRFHLGRVSGLPEKHTPQGGSQGLVQMQNTLEFHTYSFPSQLFGSREAFQHLWRLGWTVPLVAACCRLGGRCMLVATRKKEAPPMPSWVMTEPELGPELTYAFCGCQHPRDCGYSYATDITGQANLWFSLLVTPVCFPCLCHGTCSSSPDGLASVCYSHG